MNIRFVAASVVVSILTLVVVVAGAPSMSFGDLSGPESGTLPSPTPEPSLSPTPAPSPTDAPPPVLAPGRLPYGTQGLLTFRRASDLITLQLPEMEEIARMPDVRAPDKVISVDGKWTAQSVCDESACTLVISGPDGYSRSISSEGSVGGLEWSPAAPVLAYTIGYSEGDTYVRGEISLFDTSAQQSLVVIDTDPWTRQPYTWLSTGDLLVAENSGESPGVSASGPASLQRIAVDGSTEDIGTTVGPVLYFYSSPDRSRVAFTQDAEDGWRLWLVDAVSGAIEDIGNMGSDPAGVRPPTSFPPGPKGPMSVSWSPDGSMLAFGGGAVPPYTMTVVDLRSGSVARSEFVEGYAGEMTWSPDGSMLAVSTYDPDRTRHEVYVVDPKTGAARYLIAGCLIIWSPDGRFLALHAERDPGIVVIDIRSGEHGMATDDPSDVPLSWE